MGDLGICRIKDQYDITNTDSAWVASRLGGCGLRELDETDFSALICAVRHDHETHCFGGHVQRKKPALRAARVRLIQLNLKSECSIERHRALCIRDKKCRTQQRVGLRGERCQ